MKKIKEFDVKIDKDMNGLSIGVIEKFEIDGEIVSKPIKRRAFRKKIPKETDLTLPESTKSELVENENFFKEVDEWTGEKDFIKNKFNF